MNICLDQWLLGFLDYIMISSFMAFNAKEITSANFWLSVDTFSEWLQRQLKKLYPGKGQDILDNRKPQRYESIDNQVNTCKDKQAKDALNHGHVMHGNHHNISITSQIC